MVNDLLAVIAIAEVLVLILALFRFFRQRENTLAESGAYAIIAAMMLLSFLFQSGFMPGLRYPALAAEVLVVLASGHYLYRQRAGLGGDLLRFAAFAREHRIASTVVLLVLGSLAARAIFVPPAAYHWERLIPVIHCQLSNGFPPTAPSPGSLLPLYPLNTGVLGHLVLRYGTDTGLGLFGLLWARKLQDRSHQRCVWRTSGWQGIERSDWYGPALPQQAPAKKEDRQEDREADRKADSRDPPPRAG